ncbi:kinase-like domain-containing protein, partial [Chlamydoabsidia padenii]
GNVIGKGQFGIVYRALELGSGRMVAVKRIKLHSSKKRDMVDVMQEAQLLQRLGHPNIVKYEGFIQAEGHVNIILEYVENGSLLNTLKSFGSFPENLVAGYCTRILQGLEYLHDQNVVHCDLKAANLLTTKSGHVKLSDFGVSLNLGLKETEVGNVAGTPNWMAPEVIELKGASTKSDIWSLGCTIIELCTGKPPYADLLPMTALFRIVEDDYPPIPNGLSQDLCDFLQQCFAKNPNDRPTATDLLTHSWICKYHQQHNDESSFGNVVMDISTSAGIETAPHTPLDLEETDNDFPPWLLPKHHSRSPSVLAAKFQQQKQQQTHRYVKGTFSKGINHKSHYIYIKPIDSLL